MTPTEKLELDHEDREDPLYKGHSGLYSLSIDLEYIATELEKRRKNGWTPTKKIVARLRAMHINLKVLSKEWVRAAGGKSG